eukprot:Phypoly_transcript_05707.p1 GENE.Phypoly_transcript_05707~~Phypoly_transcript_05707.p1  ORF type:complete len:577 (+),score=122.71 Phypoly_transcript_05707:118-1848(+)
MSSSPTGEGQKFFGTLTVKVLETREISINWIIGRVEFTSRLSEVKKSHSKSHQFSDEFHFQVGSADAELVIEAWRKNLIMKDTLRGVFKTPISTLLDEQVHTGWYPLSKPVKPTNEEPGEGDESEEEEKEEKKKSKKKPSEVRLEMQFKKNVPPKEVLTGIILNDQWTKENSGGPLVNNAKWHMNPQYLLTVDSPCDVSIKLRQPEDSTMRASYYVVHYDEFYNGKRKVILDTSEVVKIDNFFCPITALGVSSVMQLAKGRYVIIPYTESTPYNGPFTLAVATKRMEDIGFMKIPKNPAEDWKTLRVAGEWTLSNSGGGDILGLNWRKNPQYQLQLTQQSDVCVAIEQDENTRSIGVYVVKQIDVGKKVVDYSDEVGKTDSFKYLCSSGLKIPKLPAGSYVVIPCAFDAEVVGPFRLAAYVTDPSASLTIVEAEWKHVKEVKGAWTEDQAGGSPNNVTTFTKNPQYHLSFGESDKPVHVLIQLVQESAHYEEASIGFVVFYAKHGVRRVVGGEFTGEDMFCKPDGWVPKVDVVCRAVIEPSQKRSFILIPSTFKPDIHRSFQLNVYADADITLEAI